MKFLVIAILFTALLFTFPLAAIFALVAFVVFAVLKTAFAD